MKFRLHDQATGIIEEIVLVQPFSVGRMMGTFGRVPFVERNRPVLSSFKRLLLRARFPVGSAVRTVAGTIVRYRETVRTADPTSLNHVPTG